MKNMQIQKKKKEKREEKKRTYEPGIFMTINIEKEEKKKAHVRKNLWQS